MFKTTLKNKPARDARLRATACLAMTAAAALTLTACGTSTHVSSRGHGTFRTSPTPTARTFVDAPRASEPAAVAQSLSGISARSGVASTRTRSFTDGVAARPVASVASRPAAIAAVAPRGEATFWH